MPRIPSLRNAAKEVRLFHNWLAVMLDSIGRKGPGRVTYRLRNGIEYEMRARTSDVGVLYEVWVLDSYSPPEMRLPKDAVVVDIGAHVGTFTLRAANEATSGHVYAFEPTSENFDLLSRNVERNAVRNVTIVRAAVAGAPGRARIRLDATSNAMHSLVLGDAGAKAEEVDVVSLDEFVRKNEITRIDLLKLDCEGAEYEILRTMSDRTLACVERIALEYHDVPGTPGPAFLEARLRNAGFQSRRDDAITPMIYGWRESGGPRS